MRRLAPALLLLATGCAYYSGYNGIHGANRYAAEARRSAREGRPGQAADYWARAAVKAESLLVRQPDGKWSTDARLVRGEALAALGRCSDAVVMLRHAREQVPPGHKREQAAYGLGRCEIQLGQPELAARTLAEPAASDDEDLRQDALALQGRALLLAGQDSAAVEALRGAGAPPWSVEVMAAEAGTGQLAAVLAGVDSVAAQRDSLFPWDSLFATVGRRRPDVASAALDHARATKAVPAARVPALLAADAERLQGEARRARLGEVIALAPQSESADAARFALLQERLASAGSVADLPPIADSLRVVAAAGMGSAGPATALVTQLEFVTAADSVPPAAPEGDLRLFLAAEVARDSLRATPLALQLFRRVLDGWPDGAYAPKALLAGRQLDSAWAEATDSLLEGRYAASPYVQAARGGDRASFLVLEDSLARYAIGLAAGDAGRPARPGARPQRREGQPEVDDQPRRNRPQPRGGRRVEAEP